MLYLTLCLNPKTMAKALFFIVLLSMLSSNGINNQSCDLSDSLGIYNYPLVWLAQQDDITRIYNTNKIQNFTATNITSSALLSNFDLYTLS